MYENLSGQLRFHFGTEERICTCWAFSECIKLVTLIESNFRTRRNYKTGKKITRNEFQAEGNDKVRNSSVFHFILFLPNMCIFYFKFIFICRHIDSFKK